MRKIKTGADKLVEIIQEAKRISLDDASKALGVSSSLVQEWAEFLEKEKLISIEYSFSKVFFTERTFSSKEIRSSAKEIVNEKDAFVRKVEYALASLDKESVNFEEIKKKFNSVHGDVHSEIKIVERELSELEQYNKLKGTIDKEIEAQNKKYLVEIDSLSKDIKLKESEFVSLYTKIVKEKESINDHKAHISSLEKYHKDIESYIKSANDSLLKIRNELDSEKVDMGNKIKTLSKLNDELDVLGKKVIKDKKKKIESVFGSFDKESKALLIKQEDLLNKAKIKTSKLGSYEDYGRKLRTSFEGFFNKTVALSKKMDEIDAEKKSLHEGFLNIKKKALALALMNSSSNLKKQVEEIEKEIAKQEDAKKKFIGKIRSLFDDLKL